MEEQKRTVGEQPDWKQQYLAEPKPPFSASRKEMLAAWGMYLLAFVYACWLFSVENAVWWLTGFAIGFIALTEGMHNKTVRMRESWIWLGCMGLILAGLIREALQVAAANAAGVQPPEHAVQGGIRLVCLHIFAGYWVLCRAGRLTGGQSGHLLPLDALYAFFILPFKHLFLRIRCVAASLKPKKTKQLDAGKVAAAILAAFVVLVLLSMAMTQLSAADAGFGRLLTSLRQAVSVELDSGFVFRVLLSLPVGAYLFGLIAGSGREDAQKLRSRGQAVCEALPRLRVVPEGVWLAALALFSALYLAFFFLQGQYLFGAFSRTLPEDFTVAEYARQGFFELCRVMAINFTLFWCVTRTARKQTGAVRWMAAILLAESMVFAVIALSKLALYISCFGFTPRRLQSTWLVCVLLAGSICALYTHLSGKKSMRAWMAFGALSLSLLCLW